MRRMLPLLVIVAVTFSALGGVAAASHDFPDVPDSSPFHDDISWMADAGITSGFPDGGFHPSDPVSRQSLAAFLHRMSGESTTPRVVDAAELADRTAADFDNAVSLQGRTPADFDDAVTLAGRTPADFDNAVSLQGQSPEQLQPDVFHARNTVEIIFDASSPASADTIVAIPSVPAGTYVVDVSGVYRTTWEESVVSCFVGVPLGSTVLTPAQSLERVHAGTELNLSDWGQLSGTAVVDMNATGEISLRCHWQGLSGVDGDLIARSSSIIATAVQDL
jgi:hypothetical protein